MGGLYRPLQWKVEEEEERQRQVRLWRENENEENCGHGGKCVAMGVELRFG